MSRKGEKEGTRQKCLVRCFCTTFKVAAFLCAACVIVVVVLCWMYSIRQLENDGYGDGEAQMLWALRRAYRLEVYRCAVRAQQSYERHCAAANSNFKGMTHPPTFPTPGPDQRGAVNSTVTPNMDNHKQRRHINLTTDLLESQRNPRRQTTTLWTIPRQRTSNHHTTSIPPNQKHHLRNHRSKLISNPPLPLPQNHKLVPHAPKKPTHLYSHTTSAPRNPDAPTPPTNATLSTAPPPGGYHTTSATPNSEPLPPTTTTTTTATLSSSPHGRRYHTTNATPNSEPLPPTTTSTNATLSSAPPRGGYSATDALDNARRARVDHVPWPEFSAPFFAWGNGTSGYSGRPAGGAGAGPAPVALLRGRRRYHHRSMEMTCVMNAEAAKRRALRYFFPPLHHLEGDLRSRVANFFYYADILNAVVCPIFFIFSIVLIWGIAIENAMMILAWLATILFYIVFGIFYFYLRWIFMLKIYFYFSNFGYFIGIMCLLLLLLMMAFKYYMIFTYFWALCPSNTAAADIDDVHLVIARREEKPKKKRK